MPCRDDGYRETVEEMRERANNAAETQRRLNKVTRLLCQLSRKVKEVAPEILTDEMSEWLSEHKEVDLKRIEYEIRSKEHQINGYMKQLETLKQSFSDQIASFEEKLEAAQVELDALYNEESEIEDG